MVMLVKFFLGISVFFQFFDSFFHLQQSIFELIVLVPELLFFFLVLSPFTILIKWTFTRKSRTKIKGYEKTVKKECQLTFLFWDLVKLFALKLLKLDFKQNSKFFTPNFSNKQRAQSYFKSFFICFINSLFYHH